MKDYSWAPESVRDLLHRINGKLYIHCEVCGKSRPTSGRTQVLKRASEEYRFCRAHRNDGYKVFSVEEIASWSPNHKRCNDCNEVKHFNEFHAHQYALLGRSNQCKACRKPNSKRQWAQEKFEVGLLRGAKLRSEQKELPFDLTISDIKIPDRCPILGVPIEKIRGSEYSPSLDRIVPEYGYVRDNIRVVSRRANVLKNNMSVDECKLVLADLEFLADLEAIVDIG